MPTYNSPVGIISYPALFAPKANTLNPEADPQFSVMLVWLEEHQKTQQEKFQQLRELIQQTIRERWADNAPRNMRYPVRKVEDSDSMAAQWPAGTLFCNFRSRNRPAVLRPDLTPIDSSEQSVVYAGQWGEVSFGAFAYDKAGNRGVSFGLNNVHLTRMHAERIDGRRAAADEFDAVADTSSPTDATEGAPKAAEYEDDIPF